MLHHLEGVNGAMAKPSYKSQNKSRAGSRRHAPKAGRSEARHKPSVDGKPAGGPRQKPAKPAPVTAEPIARMKWSGPRLPEKTAQVLECLPTSDYALIDSGDGEKLERYGSLIIRRPEGQALWQKQLDGVRWDAADASFSGDMDEEGQGRWRYKGEALPETWPLEFDGMPFYGRFTSFRHTGVFPEQAVHWLSLRDLISSHKDSRPVSVLNLFGYTGLASLVAARAGATVTHVDASKKAIGWARENQQLAGLDDAPIRWICDDAMKFCAREVRRGNSYDIILLDPPAYGRGPKGEVWQLFDHLPPMLDLVRQLQSSSPLMTVLTAYAIRSSHFAMHEIMQEVFAGMDGRLESGELIIRHEAHSSDVEATATRALSTSMFSRFIAKGADL